MVNVIAAPGASLPSGSRSKKKCRRSSLLLRIYAFELSIASGRLAVSAASSCPAWSLM
jgi:hypothetical protein